MPEEFAFNWRPGLLEWLIVLELVVLLVLAIYRYIAYLLGRSSPTDAFVIFYRVFWKAFRTPKAYPVPVNYQPVPPRRPKPRRDDTVEGAGLTDDEIEALMIDSLAGGDGAETPADRRDARGEPEAGADDHQSLLEVRVVQAARVGIQGIAGGVMTIGVDLAPDDGRANRIVIEQACTVLQLRQHQVGLQAGHTRADKTLRITGMSPAELAQRLEELGRAPGEQTIGFVPGS